MSSSKQVGFHTFGFTRVRTILAFALVIVMSSLASYVVEDRDFQEQMEQLTESEPLVIVQTHILF
jgi:hypothetical protein